MFKTVKKKVRFFFSALHLTINNNHFDKHEIANNSKLPFSSFNQYPMDQ